MKFKSIIKVKVYNKNPFDSEVPHDNKIYESQNFLVFIDESSDEIMVDFSDMCERMLSELFEN